MQLSAQWEAYGIFGVPAKTYGGGVGAILNTVWITVMNIVYFKIAKWLNDKENHVRCAILRNPAQFCAILRRPTCPPPAHRDRA